MILITVSTDLSGAKLPWITEERSEAGDTFLSVIELIEYFRNGWDGVAVLKDTLLSNNLC